MLLLHVSAAPASVIINELITPPLARSALVKAGEELSAPSGGVPR